MWLLLAGCLPRGVTLNWVKLPQPYNTSPSARALTFGRVLHELGLVAGVHDHRVYPRSVPLHGAPEQHLF